MYDARQIANWFVERAKRDGQSFTIMQLLKLVYIAHGWHLEMSKAPLIRNRIEAWQYGPVIPDVYNAFRPDGVKVREPLPGVGEVSNSYVESVLEHVYKTYGGMSASRLSNITHELGGPWYQATKEHGFFAPISNDAILSHYEEKRRQYDKSRDVDRGARQA